MPLDPSAALLTDKIAVVTGAAQGIGRAIAETYARFGAHLAICDRLEDGLAETAAAVRAEGRECVTGVLDVRDRDAVDAHVAEVAERFGRIDVLVNNAGGTFFSDFLAVSDNGHRALVANNFTQVTHFVRACAPHMPSGGSIITVTSIEAHRAGPGFAVYSAMKAACTSLTQTLALELGERMIRVNTIAPDVITTPGVGGAVGAANGAPARGPARRLRRRRRVPGERPQRLRHRIDRPRRRGQRGRRRLAPLRREAPHRRADGAR